jgi:DNA-binding transcriptional LysR family regulator
MEIGSREAIREAVIMGVGIAVVSEIEYIPDPEIRQVLVSDAQMYTYAHVFCLKERRGARLVKEFLGIVAELLRDGPPARARKKAAMP